MFRVIPLLLLAGCATVKEPPPLASTYCQIARPVMWSAADTRETKEAVDTENRKYKKLCMPAK